MANNHNQRFLKIINKPFIKSVIAALLFHIVYSFAFGMLIGGKNALVFLYENDYKLLYMILTPLIASLPYLFSGYLIVLGRNSYDGLKKTNTNLMITSLIASLIIYVFVFGLHYIFPYRNFYDYYLFLNYPAASYLSVMDMRVYGSDVLVILSAILPSIMTFVGGLVRIKTINRGDFNGQNS